MYFRKLKNKNSLRKRVNLFEGLYSTGTSKACILDSSTFTFNSPQLLQESCVHVAVPLRQRKSLKEKMWRIRWPHRTTIDIRLSMQTISMNFFFRQSSAPYMCLEHRPPNRKRKKPIENYQKKTQPHQRIIRDSNLTCMCASQTTPCKHTATQHRNHNANTDSNKTD